MIEPDQSDDDDGSERHPQPLQRAQEIAALPGEAAVPPRPRASSGTISGAKVRSKNGQPTDSFGPAQRIEEQRIERAQEHRRGRQVSSRLFEHERALARDRREEAAALQRRRAHRRRASSEPPIATSSSRRMKMPRRGSTAKAWTEVSTPERTRKVPTSDSEKVMMASRTVQLLSVSRFSTTIAEWTQRRADEPRHERGVLDRVPEPPAAPAERVIGPPAAHRDADGEGAPRGERPRPDPARPGGIDPPLDERRHGEAEGDREADIAEIEERRMEGEAGILQHRIEPVADRRRRQPGAWNGFEVNRMNSRKPRRSCPARRARAPRSAGGRLSPNQATAAPNSDRMNTHSTIEPS